jgi:PAS domain-containing protein
MVRSDPAGRAGRVARRFPAEDPPRNITEEIPLAAVDPRLGALLELTSDGVMLRDRQGRVVFANEGAAQALGLDGVPALQSLTPDELAAMFTVEEADGARRPLGAFPGALLFRGGQEPDLVLRFSDPANRRSVDGDRWVSVRTRPFAEENGKLITVLSLLRDMTPERRREGSLRFLDEAQTRLGRALSSARVLEHATVVAVPRLGDECLIAERNGDGVFMPAAWYMPGVSGAERAYALGRGLAPLFAQVETGGRALLVAASGGEWGVATAGSMVLAPVHVDGEVIAVMVLPMVADTGRCHRPSDLALAEQLADRVGLALRNIRLLEAAERRLEAAQASESAVRALAHEWESWTTSFVGDMATQLPPLEAAAELLKHDALGPQRAVAAVVVRQVQRLRAMVDAFNDGDAK